VTHLLSSTTHNHNSYTKIPKKIYYRKTKITAVMCDTFLKLQTSNRRSNRSNHNMNQMSKFELNLTVNESGKSILLKLRISEKYIVAQRPSQLTQRLRDASRIREITSNIIVL